jgi:hypothetical protein
MPDLGDDEVDAMYALYDRYYGGGDAMLFRADLAQKSHLIWLAEGDRLCGFSTLATQTFRTSVHEARAVFSGDTIIDHEYWGEQALARAFSRFAGELKAERPTQPLYWLLISKGYRTYRYLHAFAHRYFPHPHEATPPEVQACMDTLACSRFGDAYRADLGIVRFDPVRGYLRSPWNGIRQGLQPRPEVRLFLERNAGYADGDELVCLTELSESNLRSIARREFLRGYEDGRRADAA